MFGPSFLNKKKVYIFNLQLQFLKCDDCYIDCQYFDCSKELTICKYILIVKS